MSFLITTTGVISPIVLEDLGRRTFYHPTVDFDLQSEYSIEEIRDSIDFSNSLLFGYLTASYNGTVITSIDELNPVISSDNRLYIRNQLVVKKNPGLGEFSSIKDAVDSITTATFSSQWVVSVGPGLFIEDTINMKSYVHIKGSNRSATIIEVDNPSKNAIVGKRTSSITDCTIQGATSSGFAAIYFSNNSSISGETYAFLVEDCSFGANNILIHAVGATGAPTSIVASGIIKGTDTGNYVQGFVSENSGGLTTTITLRNSQIIASSITSEAIFATGTAAQIIMSSTSISRLGIISQTAVKIANGGLVRMFGVDIRSHSKGIWMVSGGAAPSINAVAVEMSSNTQDIVVDHTGATGLIDGVFNRVTSFIDPSSTVVLNGLDRKIIRVATLDTDFQTLEDAIDSITDASPTNRYVISIGPGIFIENPFILKPYIEIIGSGPDSTYILNNNPSVDFITASGNTTMKNMKIGGASASNYLFIYNGDALAGNFVVTNCVFTNADRILKQRSINGYSIALFAECSFDSLSYFTTGFDIQDDGVNPCLNGISSFSWIANSLIAVGFNDFVKISGSLSKCIASNLYIGTDSGSLGVGSDCYHILDGATMNISGLQFHGFSRAIYAENSGTAPSVTVTDAQLVNNTTDINIEHPNTVGSFQGAADMSKVSIDSNSTFNISIQDLSNGSFNISNKLNIRFPNGELTDISTLIIESSTMGVMEGGDLSEFGGFTVSIAEGFGYIENFPDNDTVKRIDWSNISLGLSASSINYIYFNYNGILTTSSSIPDTFFNILLGRVVTNNTGIKFIDATPLRAEHIGNRLSLLNRHAIGPIFVSGSGVSEADPFHLNVGSGHYHFAENVFMPSGGATISFLSYYRDGAGGFISSATNSVDSSYYDNGSGTLQGLSASNYTKHSLYLVGEGVNEKYFLVYGQEQFNNLSLAEQGNIPLPPTYFTDSVVLISSIIVQQGTSSIVEILDNRPIIGFRPPTVSASTYHGNLLGLGNDDHQQYLLVSGGRSMTGNLDMGGNQITNSGNINGVNIATHSSRHLPNGSDPITTGTPSSIGSVNQEGIANAFSRQDHIHAIGSNIVSDANILAHTSSKITIVNKSQLNTSIIYNDQVNSFNYLTFSGTVSMSSNKIINLATGSNALDGVNYGQLINQIGTPIYTINGLTGPTQFFTSSNDTNVILNISSIGTTHSYNLSWNGLLPLNRGGLSNSTFTASQILIVNPGTSAVISSGYRFNDSGTSSTDILSANQILSLTSSYIRIGNSSNLSTARPITGDITLSNTGVVSINSNVITDANISTHSSTKITISNKSQLNANIAYVDQSNTFGTFSQLFKSSNLYLSNPTNTFNYQFIGSALTASKSVTLPLLISDDIFVFEAFSQTLTNKTLLSNTNVIDATRLQTFTISTTSPTASNILSWNGTSWTPTAISGDITLTNGNAQLVLNTIVDADISTHSSTKITITNKPQLNSSIVYVDQSNTFGTFSQLFKSSNLYLSNPTNTFHYQFIGSAITSTMSATLPLLTSSDTFVFESFSQSMTNKTLLSTSNNVIDATRLQTFTVSTTTPSTGDSLVWNGTNWTPITVASYQATPADPATTTSLVGVMMGLSGSITPTKTGKVLIVISGDTDNATNVRGTSIQIRTGTGSAPTNGSALTGTARGGLVSSLGASNTNRLPFSCNCLITGSIGTLVWIDISLAVNGASGTARVRNISISAIEI